MELTVDIEIEALIDRPMLGHAPWLDAPASNDRWQKLRPFLEYLNSPAYHFQMMSAVYRREIEKFALDNNGLAGHLKKPEEDGGRLCLDA